VVVFSNATGYHSKLNSIFQVPLIFFISVEDPLGKL